MKNLFSTKIIGVLAILGAAFTWAIEPIFARYSFKSSGIVQTLLIRLFITSIIAYIYILFTRKGNLKISKFHFSKIAYTSLLGTLIGDLLYLYSLTKIPVVNAVLIGHLQPIFIIIVGYFALKTDKLTIYDYIGIVLMILAGFTVTTRTFSNLKILHFGTLGDLFVLISTICWAMAGLLTRKYLTKLNSGIITFYRFMNAVIIFSIYLLIKKQFFIPNIYQILLGVIIGIGYILYFEGVKRIKAAQAAALEITSIFFAAIFGFIFFKEIITYFQTIGLFLMLMAVYFLSKREYIHKEIE